MQLHGLQRWGTGTKPVANSLPVAPEIKIDVPASAAPGSTIWFSMQADLSEHGSSWTRSSPGGPGDGETGVNGQVVPLELVVMAEFDESVPPTQRFSGWVGRSNHAMLDESESRISPGLGANIGVSGVDRLLRNQSILVPDVPAGGGSSQSGMARLETGTMLFRADGGASWYSDNAGSSPGTQEELNGDILTDRYGNKSEFNADGDLIERKDPAGNTTSYTYNPNGSIDSITDAFGQETMFSYYVDGGLNSLKITTVNAQGNAELNRIRILSWLPPTGLVDGELRVKYDDPDGPIGGACQLLQWPRNGEKRQ